MLTPTPHGKQQTEFKGRFAHTYFLHKKHFVEMYSSEEEKADPQTLRISILQKRTKSIRKHFRHLKDF